MGGYIIDYLPEQCDDSNCGCNHKPRYVPESLCTLNKPIWMVIPPEGTHISCPVHGKHWLRGSGMVVLKV